MCTTSASRHRDVECVNSPDQRDSGTTAECVATGTGEAEAPISIEMLSATRFEILLAGAEVLKAFVIRLWQGTGLLGGTMRMRPS